LWLLRVIFYKYVGNANVGIRHLATLHLLHGFVGSGKTTFAKSLEKKLRAIRMTHDEWMVRLYGANPPAELFSEYYSRISAQIWDLTRILLQLGVDVILDFGFWSRASRDDARERAHSMGATVKLYSIDCPMNVMRRRVMARSRQMPPGELFIDEHAFELFVSRFEALGEDEAHEVVKGS
jgi:predicted kinase